MGLWEKKGAERHGRQSGTVKKLNNLLVSAIYKEANKNLLWLTVCCTFGVETQLDPAASHTE